jgi:uncharacterized protein YpmB
MRQDVSGLFGLASEIDDRRMGMREKKMSINRDHNTPVYEVDTLDMRGSRQSYVDDPFAQV